MCKFLSNIDFSVLVDVMTALIALYSAKLLYRTYEDSKEIASLQKQNMELDKKAKEGEYLPIIRDFAIIFNPLQQVIGDGYGGVAELIPIFNIENQLSLRFTVIKNSMRINNIYFCYYINIDNQVPNAEFREIHNAQNENFLIPDQIITFSTEATLDKIFTLENTTNQIRKIEYYHQYRDQLILKFKLKIMDSIGNNYEMIIQKHNNETQITEYKKA